MSQVRLDFMGRVSPANGKESICSESVRNVGSSFCHNGRNQEEVGDWQN